MKYFITGASGFLGRHLVKMLLQEGESVVACDRVPFDVDHSNFEFIEADLNEGISGLETDIFVHLVGSPGVWFSEKNPELDKEINVTSLTSALEVLDKKRLKKVVLASTCQIYGDGVSDESSKLTPSNNYGRNKLEAEHVLKEWCKKNDVEFTILRMTWVYGPGMKKNPIFDVYNRKLFLSKSSELDFVFVEDVCDAYILASKSRNWDGKEVNISSGVGFPLTKIEEYFREFGLDGEVEEVPEKKKIFVLSNDFAKSLGWSPKTDIKEGLRKTYESFSR